MHAHRFRFLSGLLIICCVLASFPAMGSASSSPAPFTRTITGFSAKTLAYLPEKARERTDAIVIGVPNLSGAVSPFWARTDGDATLCALLFDELLYLDSDGRWGSGVADIEIAFEGRMATFTLKKNVRYTDGQPLTSDDFINALYLITMPGYDGCYDATRAGITGLQGYLNGDTPTIQGIERLSETSFRLTFDTANANHLSYLAVPALRTAVYGNMIRPDTLLVPEDFPDFYAQRVAIARLADATHMAYGQYRLVEIQPGVNAVFTDNPDYYRGDPFISRVELLVVLPGQELQAILLGDVDIVYAPGSVETVDTVYNYEQGFINLHVWMSDVVGYLGMDLENALFQDPIARYAIAQMIDREGLRAATLGVYASVPNRLTFDGFDSTGSLLPDHFLQYDPYFAKAVLQGQGFATDERNVLTRGNLEYSFTLSYAIPNPISEAIASSLQRSWKEFGLNATLDPVSFETLVDRIERNDVMMYLTARQLPPTAAEAANLFMGESHLNDTGYMDSTLQRYLAWADATTDPERQSVVMEAFYQELALETTIIPLYRRSNMLLVSARILNATVTPQHDIVADIYRFMLTDTLDKKW